MDTALLILPNFLLILIGFVLARITVGTLLSMLTIPIWLAILAGH